MERKILIKIFSTPINSSYILHLKKRKRRKKESNIILLPQLIPIKKERFLQFHSRIAILVSTNTHIVINEPREN